MNEIKPVFAERKPIEIRDESISMANFGTSGLRIPIQGLKFGKTADFQTGTKSQILTMRQIR